jgi:CRISPR-associated protein Cas1
MLPHIKPLPIKDRISLLFVAHGNIDVLDGAFVVVDKTGIRTHIPVGSISCLMLEPGTRVSHAAMGLAAKVGTLLIWVGEGGVRLYAAGQPGGARSDNLLYQAKLALDETARLKIVRYMYEMRFGEPPPAKRSVEQLRGIEGARVKEMYKLLAKRYKVPWKGRNYNVKDWEAGDVANRCISAATACLYGICEAAILAAGYAPAIGFIHTGKPQSFVYDVADIFKFESVVPLAFKVAASHVPEPDRVIRKECRRVFTEQKILERLVPTIQEILDAGELDKEVPTKGTVPVAIPLEERLDDVGHRY